MGAAAGFFRNVLMGEDNADIWCDDTATEAMEDCAAILERSLSLAVAELEQRYGSDRNDWLWGPIHTAVSDHNPMTNVPVLKDLFDLDVPVGGDSYGECCPRPDAAQSGALRDPQRCLTAGDL